MDKETSITESTLTAKLSKAARLLDALSNREIRSHGLLRSDFDVLSALLGAEPEYRLSPKQLCAELQFSSGGMTPVLLRLRQAGLISREQSPEDGRGRSVVLTELGGYVIRKLSAQLQQFETRLLSGIRTGQLTQLHRNLDSLLEHCSG